MELETWLAFRQGEMVDDHQDCCCNCNNPIPHEDDVITLSEQDGTLIGRICEKCFKRNG